jgi:hypothetical protein
MTVARKLQLNRAIGKLQEMCFELRLLPLDLAEETESVLMRTLAGMSAAIRVLETEKESPALAGGQALQGRKEPTMPRNDTCGPLRTQDTAIREAKGGDTCQ